MYGELDGTFPNHPADPIQPANQRDLQARVVAVGADVGLAFDRRRRPRLLRGRDRPGSVGLHHHRHPRRRHPRPGAPGARSCTTSSARGPYRRSSSSAAGCRCARALATPTSSRSWRRRGRCSGASTRPTTTSATITGPTPGSSPRWCCSSSCHRRGVPLSELRKPFERYAASGEINTEVGDPAAVLERVAEGLRRPPAGPPRRAHGRRRAMVVQPAAVQHRTAPAPEPRGAHARGVRRAGRRGAGPRDQLSGRTTTRGPRSPAARDSRVPPGQGVRSCTSPTRTRCTTPVCGAGTGSKKASP